MSWDLKPVNHIRRTFLQQPAKTNRYLLRQPALDYTSLDSPATMLGRLFWADLERHHPGIASLHLPAGVATAWKQRLRTVTRTVRVPAGSRPRSASPASTTGNA